jgi:hypothetical protein
VATDPTTGHPWPPGGPAGPGGHYQLILVLTVIAQQGPVPLPERIEE